MRTLLRFALILSLLTMAVVHGQEALTNDTILKLAKAGLGDDVIVSMITSQATNFSLRAEDVLTLKQGGVSDKVIGAMIKKGAGAGTPAAPTAAATAATAAPAGDAPPASPSPVSEVGVYYMKGGVWMEMMPEVVNWKTGGVLKSMATVGVVKGDINGRIAGPHAKAGLSNPARVLVYTPEGTGITEYQLLKLREKDEAREFRTVTGGVFHVSGGANRDLIQMDYKKVASRTFELVLSPNMGAGEYGILPPGGAMSSGASSQLGKMYTFRILD